MNRKLKRGTLIALSSGVLITSTFGAASAAPIDGVDPNTTQAKQAHTNENTGIESLGRATSTGIQVEETKANTGVRGRTLEKTDRFIVKFATSEKSAKEEAVSETDSQTPLSNAKMIRERADGTTIVENDKDLTKEEQKKVIEDLKADPRVESVEPDLVIEKGTAAYPSTPNDPYYNGYQWNMKQINASGAWKSATGKGVTIGIADTGSTYHPDLSAKWRQGYDFISDNYYSKDGGGRDSNPQDMGDDVHGPGMAAWHGTHVSGIAAASTNNRMGVAGVAPDSNLVMGRNMGRNGRGYISDYADSVMWLAGIHIPGVPDNKNAAKVVNLSEAFDSATCPAVMKTSIDKTHAKGVPVVVAAGNSGVNANYVAPANCLGAIVVGATSAYGGLTGYSNWGPMLDVVAPGGTTGADIWSTVNSGTYSLGVPTYGPLNGTSMAAPHVAGIIAEMKERDPNLGVEAIRGKLQSTGGWSSGYRLANAKRAVESVPRKAPPSKPSGYIVRGGIKSFYDANGGERTFGKPRYNEKKSVGGGVYQGFSNNQTIYWSPTTKEMSMNWNTGIAKAFKNHDFERGLGYPSSREIRINGVKNPGVYQNFNKYWEKSSYQIYWGYGRDGTIRNNSGIGAKYHNGGGASTYGVPLGDGTSKNGHVHQFFKSLDDPNRLYLFMWSEKTGTHVIKQSGAIGKMWVQGGRENGKYGLPTTDEYSNGKGHIQQKFSNGWTLDWDRSTGRTIDFKS